LTGFEDVEGLEEEPQLSLLTEIEELRNANVQSRKLITTLVVERQVVLVVPWNSLVPDLETTDRRAPPDRPFAAEKTLRRKSKFLNSFHRTILKDFSDCVVFVIATVNGGLGYGRLNRQTKMFRPLLSDNGCSLTIVQKSEFPLEKPDGDGSLVGT
jgi:hypothetical protein